MCEALTYLLDNIFNRFGTKLYRQIVGIPMGTNCAPLITDLFLFGPQLSRTSLGNVLLKKKRFSADGQNIAQNCTTVRVVETTLY